MADTVEDTTTGTQASAEAERVRAAATGAPTVITDDPEETGSAAAVVTESRESVAGEPATVSETAVEDPEDASGPLAAVARTLGDLSRRELERLHGAIEGALRGKGTEPDKPGPTLSELASRLPVNEAATEAVSAEAAAGAFEGVSVGDLLSWKVRQKTDVEGNPSGPAYLRIVTRDGQKLTAQHK